MAVYTLPWSKDEQIKVCVALKNVSFVGFSEKDEIDKIEQNLSGYRELSESEKAFLEKMIAQHGSSLNI